MSLEFNTDGRITRFGPTDGQLHDTMQILVVTKLHEHLFNLKSNSAISLFDAVDLPANFHKPELYDGSQNLSGRNVLMLMLNGWGDMILIQPALRALYKKSIAQGKPCRLTIGCNWINNFPYPGVPFIHDVCPNIMTLKELCSYEIIVNLIPANYRRSYECSMRDIVLELLKIEPVYGGRETPCLQPDPQRVGRVSPILADLRKKTMKKLLCVNWRSRFNHKNAPIHLFNTVVNNLSAEYQAVLFKNEEDSRIMQTEINEWNMPIVNLSPMIHDYHDTTAALSLVDAFISVDTGIVHAGGALGIPGVALFGPFPPKTHVDSYSSIIAVRASYRGKYCEQGPCLETHRGCAELNYASAMVSPCFLAIEPGQVIDALDAVTQSHHRANKLC